MAIDTVSKRRSALGAFPIWPLADSEIGADDRRAAAWIYSGIESGVAPEPEPEPEPESTGTRDPAGGGVLESSCESGRREYAPRDTRRRKSAVEYEDALFRVYGRKPTEEEVRVAVEADEAAEPPKPTNRLAGAFLLDDAAREALVGAAQPGAYVTDTQHPPPFVVTDAMRRAADDEEAMAILMAMV